MIQTHVKQPSESRLYNFDFSALLVETNETISSVNSITSNIAGTVEKPGLTIGTPVISGSKVQVRISGGSAVVEYKLTCKITTSASNLLEGEGLLKVQDL